MKQRLIVICALNIMAAMALTGCSIFKGHREAGYTQVPGPSTPGPTGPQVAVAPLADTTPSPDQSCIELRKEELVVGKRQVSNGGVLIRTVVQTENVSQPVELRREEYVIERIPADQAAAFATNATTAFQNQEIYLPCTREEAVAGKRVLLTDKIQIGKRVETDTATVTHPVRSESVEIVKTPAKPPSGVTTLEAPAAVAAQPADLADDNVKLAREEMVVGKKQVENGAVRVRKVITTQDASQPVELKREEYAVTRTPLGEQQIQDVNFNPRQIKLDLSKEEAVAGTRNLLTEVVRVRKQVTTDNQVVTGTVRKESYEVVKMPSGTIITTNATAKITPTGPANGKKPLVAKSGN